MNPEPGMFTGVNRGNGEGNLLRDARVTVVPISNEAQVERLKIASAWDGHPSMLLPTHLVLKRDEIVGCTSLGACLMAHTWLSTEKCRGLDASRAIHDMVTVARAIGFRGVTMVSPREAPLERHLPDLGWKDLGDVRLWVKFLK
jgi:hypothetical protein